MKTKTILLAIALLICLGLSACESTSELDPSIQRAQENLFAPSSQPTANMFAR